MSPDSATSFTVTVSREDLAAWWEWWWRNRESRATRWISGYVLPVLMLAVALTPPYDLYKVAPFALGSLLLAGIAVWRNVRFRQNAVGQLGSPEFASWHGEKQHVLTESYIEQSDEAGGVRMEWGSTELATTSTHIFVILAARAFVLPRAQLSAEVQAALMTRRAGLPAPSSATGESNNVRARVEYVPRDKDGEAEYGPLFRIPWPQRLWHLGIGGTIGAIAGLATGQRDEPLTLACTIGLGAIFCLGVAYLLRWEGRKRYARQLAIRDRIEVVLAPEAVIMKVDGVRTRLPWEAVESLKTGAKGIRLEGGGGTLFVPRHAFESDSDYRDFARTAWSLHGSEPPRPAPPGEGW